MSLPTKTYAVLLYGAPQHMPTAVCGATGKTYGHAVYDRRKMAHVLRIPAAVWEPTPDLRGKGAGKDIFENTRRRKVINVVCEPGVDPESASLALAEEIDRLQVRNAELERLVADFPKAHAAAKLLLETLAPAAPAGTVSESATVARKPAGLAGSIQERLAGLGFRPLRDIAKQIEGIDVKKLKKMDDLVSALAAVPGIERYLPAPEAVAA